MRQVMRVPQPVFLSSVVCVNENSLEFPSSIAACDGSSSVAPVSSTAPVERLIHRGDEFVDCDLVVTVRIERGALAHGENAQRDVDARPDEN
jgi:hypothetical protein